MHKLSISYRVMLVLAASVFLTGFDFSESSIPIDQILSGGSPKDGIPALYDPKFILVSEVAYLNKDARVLGLSWGGVRLKLILLQSLIGMSLLMIR